jgi:hypothetical protein
VRFPEFEPENLKDSEVLKNLNKMPAYLLFSTFSADRETSPHQIIRITISIQAGAPNSFRVFYYLKSILNTSANFESTA